MSKERRIEVEFGSSHCHDRHGHDAKHHEQFGQHSCYLARYKRGTYISPLSDCWRPQGLPLCTQAMYAWLRRSTKRKLVSVTGIPVESQSLSLSRSESDGSGSQILSEDDRPLGFYGVTSGMHIKARCHLPASRPSISYLFTCRSPTSIPIVI